jgi:hypothetical protein
LRDVRLDAGPAELYGHGLDPQFLPSNALYANAGAEASRVSLVAFGSWSLTGVALQAAQWSHFEGANDRSEDWLTDADGGLLFAMLNLPFSPGGQVELAAPLPFEVSYLQCGLGPEAEAVVNGVNLTLGRAMLDAGGQRWLVSVNDAQFSDLQGHGELQLLIARDGLLVLGAQ